MKKFFIGLASSPVIWGLAATFVFYFALDAGFVSNETIVRYCAGHPVEYATTAMFLIGLADLLLKLSRTRGERRSLKRGALFPPKRAERESVAVVDDYLATIEKARDVRGESSYLTRLKDALDFMKFGGSPDDLDQELRFLADEALDRRDGEYGMVRTFIWAIPILGFLGTVLGITVALGSLDLTHIEATGDSLAAGLKVAFDTTALALSLVFVLYFLQFFSRKQDAALASSVSKLVDSELKGRFYSEAETETARREDLETARRLKAIADAFEDATRAQTAIWTAATSDVAQKSAELSLAVAERLGDALDKRLEGCAAALANALDSSRGQFIDSIIRPILDEAARKVERLDSLESRVANQTDALNEVLKASADVVALDERLTRALEKIAEVGEFEKTLNNLSATVCLLNSKLTSTSAASNADAKSSAPRRAARRSKALAALDSLERSVEPSEEAVELSPAPLVFHNFDESELSAEPASDELETLELDETEASSTRSRSLLGRKRSA